MSNLLIPYALNSGGNLVHVSEVLRGAACGCVCPACEAPLIARKGKIKAHHFAHANSQSACESALHATAKLLLFQRIQQAIEQGSELRLNFDCAVCQRQDHGNLLDIAAAVHLETEIPGANIRPDISLADANGNLVAFIEIVYKHSPDVPVLAYAKNHNILLLEFVIEDVNGLDSLIETPLTPTRTNHELACESVLHAEARLLLLNRIQRTIEQSGKLPLNFDCPVCQCRHDGNLLRKAAVAHLETQIPGANICPDILLTDANRSPVVFIEIIRKNSPSATVLAYAKKHNILLLEFVIEDFYSLNSLLKVPLTPMKVTFGRCPCTKCSCERCSCKRCPHCYERLCPHKGHSYCEPCNQCINFRALEDYGLPETHRDCPGCGEHLVFSLGHTVYPQCYCCHIANKFGRARCPKPDPDPQGHKHCRRCGLRIKPVYDICYQCLQKETVERITEVNETREVRETRESHETRESREKELNAWAELSRELQSYRDKNHR